MAIVTDPDNLRRSTNPSGSAPTGELYINPTATPPIIEIISTDDDTGGTVSNIDPSDGVSLQAIYSKLKELWKSEADLIKYPFPMEAITSEQFEFINNWELDDTTTASRSYVRFGGWSEKDASGLTKQEFMSVITLGTFVLPASQKAYYFWDTDASKTDFTYFGPVNQAIKIYGDGTHGSVDHRTDVLTVAIRPDTTGTSGNVVGYTYDQSTTTDIGASSVTYQAYRFPLSSVVDLNLTLTNSEITALESSKSITLTWYATDQASNTFLPFDLSGGPYNFRVIINGDGTMTRQEAYNWVQWSLRQNADIDDGAGTENGYLTEPLVVFVGDVLQTYSINGGTFGVAVDGFNTGSETNFLSFRDNTNTLREFSYVAGGSIVVNSNLIEDAASKYWMFYTTNPTGNYGTATAVLVTDNSSNDITGDVHNSAATAATGSSSGVSNGSASASGTTMTVGSAGWTVNDFQGKVLVVTSGNNSGYYWIASNTADTITVETAFEATDAAMSWEIRNKNTTGVIGWDYDYTNNTDGGRTANSDADITVIGLGLNSAQYVSTTSTIAKATGQNISLVAALERNYNDPT